LLVWRAVQGDVGLNDVIVWSVILHLVRRDVFPPVWSETSSRQSIAIAAGGAHIYAPSIKAAVSVAGRQPLAGQQPHLLIDVDNDTDLFALAQGTRRTAPRREDHHAG
jgi:hypothetical protein